MSEGYLNKKQRIVAMLRAEYEKASEAFRNAYATRIGMDAAANAWDDSNPDNGVGGMSQNPYSSDQWSKREEAAKLYAAQMREAYEFAVDTFLKNE